MREIENIPVGLTIKIPWERFTARGFGISLIIVPILLYIMSLTQCNIAPLREREIRSIELTQLKWGDGDGTGNNGGNLQKEGIKKTGKQPSLDIEDAARATKTKTSTTAETDINSATNVKPVKELGSATANTGVATGTKELGAGKEGLITGTGLGNLGDGAGSGEGWGLQWGGGGNRSVMFKKIPKYPEGATATLIRVKFRVTPEGTVGQMNFMTKGDPQLENEVTKALRMWRFNKIKDDEDMEGTITFSFRSN